MSVFFFFFFFFSIAKDPKHLHAASEDSDQNAQMRSLI